jgi:hypothetical protein
MVDVEVMDLLVRGGQDIRMASQVLVERGRPCSVRADDEEVR